MKTARVRSEAGFAQCFGGHPRWVASAPGRVNLIGEFTDYNDGFVLPMALDRRTEVAVALNESQYIHVRSEIAEHSLTIGVQQPLAPEPKGQWGNYIRGVIDGFKKTGVSLRGFNAYIASDVPIGAGLSSSAALEVAWATALEALHQVHLAPLNKILLCQKAEHVFAQVPCGVMDPFIATLARQDHALLLDCDSNEPVWLPFSDPVMGVLVVDTKVKHQLSTSAYSVRREECRVVAEQLQVTTLRDASIDRLLAHQDRLDRTLFRRARHVIQETARTVQAAHCICKKEWLEFGQLMDASHESLKNDYEVSCTELDTVVRIAHEIGTEGGVYGARMTGGGFGGCAVVLIDTARRARISDRIFSRYRAETGITPTLLSSRAGNGAELDELQ